MDILTTVASMTLSTVAVTDGVEGVEGVEDLDNGAASCASEDNDEDPLKDFEPLTDALVYAMGDEQEIEIMPQSDVTKVRVQLKESFSGIPLPPVTNSKQKKIDKSHARYKLAVGMMTGIREAVGGMDGLLEADFEENDFHQDTLIKECRRNRKYSFHGSPQGNDTYEFKAYAPLVFARIRSCVGIDKNLFLHAVCGNFQYLEFMSNAKSGSFFFFSHDGRYLIKTLSTEECHFLVKILPSYYHYIVNNPDSFLTRFYGLYRLQTTEQTIHFSIMKSVLDTPLPMSHTYDLKGSTLGREAKAHESVKKDLDIMKEGRKLNFCPTVQESVLRQLKRDATLLARLGIMDYSFLLGVHEQPEDTLRASLVKGGNDEHEEVLTPGQKHLQQHLITDDHLRRLDGGRAAHHEDEFVDWETIELIPCMDDCSISTSCSESLFGPSNSLSLWNGSTAADDDWHPFTTREDRGIESVDKRFIYYAGIIDILQPYNTLKWGETVVKKVQGNSEQEISCVDPETYGNRFIKFVSHLMKS